MTIQIAAGISRSLNGLYLLLHGGSRPAAGLDPWVKHSMNQSRCGATAQFQSSVRQSPDVHLLFRQRFKRSVLALPVRRLSAGVLAFVNFLLLVRLLTKPEFGANRWRDRLLGNSARSSMVGIGWVADMHLPSYRFGASTGSSGVPAPAGHGARAGADAVLRHRAAAVAIHRRPVRHARMGGGVPAGMRITLTDGVLLRFLRDQILDGLLMQGVSQSALTVKNTLTTIFLALGAFGLIHVDVVAVMPMEIFTCIVAIIIVALALALSRGAANWPAGGAAPKTGSSRTRRCRSTLRQISSPRTC